MDGKESSNKGKSRFGKLKRVIQEGERLEQRRLQRKDGGDDVSKGTRRIATRAGNAGKAFRALGAFVKGPTGWQDPKGGASGGAKLDVMGTGSVEGVRPTTKGSGDSNSRNAVAGIFREPRIKNPKTAIYAIPRKQNGSDRVAHVLSKTGKIVGVVPVHYRQPTNSDHARLHPKVSNLRPKLNELGGGGVPLAQGSVYEGGQAEQFEYMTKQGRSVRSVGQMYLQTLYSGGQNNEAGQRILFQPILPAALGGPLELLAQAFEQHKVHKLRFIYVPVLPATSSGAIAMYFRNDVFTPNVDTGLDELRHAGTHAAFCQTQVWEPAVLDVKPEDAINKYFNETDGSFQLSMQGVFQVLTASDITSVAGTIGNVYLEYDIEFFGEELDYNEGTTYAGEMLLVFNGVPHTAGDYNYAIFGFVGTPAPAATNFVLDAAAAPPSADYLFFGWITLVNFTSPSTTSVPQFSTNEDPNLYNFAVGQGFYLAPVDAATGDPPNYFNGNLGGVLCTGPPDPTAQDGESKNSVIIYFPATGTWSGNIEFRVQAMPLAD